MDDIEEVNNNIDIYKLAFIGSNKDKFNFNTYMPLYALIQHFDMPLNFLLNIYNTKISLNKRELSKEI